MSYYISGLIGSFALVVTFLFVKEFRINIINNDGCDKSNSRKFLKDNSNLGKYILKTKDEACCTGIRFQNKEGERFCFYGKENEIEGSSELNCTNSLRRDASIDKFTEFKVSNNENRIDSKFESPSEDSLQPKTKEFMHTIFGSLLHSLRQYKNMSILILTIGASVRHTGM